MGVCGGKSGTHVVIHTGGAKAMLFCIQCR